MTTNILLALINSIKNPNRDVITTYNSNIRINSVGEALEFYIRDLFCQLDANDTNVENKILKHGQYFSYIGNQNNPPDVMIRGGDAIEVKKIESEHSSIALNSSYPKDKLYSNSPMITKGCREAEDWTEKDLIYAIGTVKDSKLKKLWFVYGDCYAASMETYEKIAGAVSAGLNNSGGIEFGETTELARINRVDPLGITYLRVRGMWGIENPSKVFHYITELNTNANDIFTVNALMLKVKYDSFPKADRENLENLSSEKFIIKDIKIKSPNNPAILLEAKILSFKI